MKSKPRSLSSLQTVFWKVLFAPLWIAGFGAGTVGLFVSGREPAWPLALAWIGGSTLIYWSCLRLKRVSIDAEALYVSNYFRTIRIPLRQVSRVSEVSFSRGPLVTIEFAGRNSFGRSIVFMPKVRWRSSWGEHPVIGEIRAAVAAAPALGEPTKARELGSPAR